MGEEIAAAEGAAVGRDSELKMIYGFEKYVGCEPYKDRAIETKSQGGALKFNYMVSKNLLVPMKVVYANIEAELFPGDVVYVRHADIAGNADWSREVEVDGEVNAKGEPRMIMAVPLDRIMLVKKDE